MTQAKTHMQAWLALALTVLFALALGVSLAFAQTAAQTVASGLNITVTDAFTLASIIMSQLFTAGAVYGAIKADLKHLHERTTAAHESAKRAHERIDTFYERGGTTERRR